jgi:hypothetical protein
MTAKSITISLDWDEYDRLVNDAIIDQATTIAQDIAILLRMESPKPHNLEDLIANLYYLDGYLAVIRYNNSSEEAEEIINRTLSIFENDEERNED